MPGKLHKPVRNGMFPIWLKSTQFHTLYYIIEKIPIIIVKEIDFGVSLEIFILGFPEPKKVFFTKYPWLGLAPKPLNQYWSNSLQIWFHFGSKVNGLYDSM